MSLIYRGPVESKHSKQLLWKGLSSKLFTDVQSSVYCEFPVELNGLFVSWRGDGI